MSARRACRCTVAAAAVVVLHASHAVSEQTGGTNTFVAGRVGANMASEPTLGNGTSFGGGGSIGFFFTPVWAVELEAWVPGYVEAEHGSYRTLLFGVSARRFLGGGRVRPFLLIGGAIVRGDNDLPEGHSVGVDLGVQAGCGLRVPLSGRLALEPALHLNWLPMMGIFRPTVALVWSVP